MRLRRPSLTALRRHVSRDFGGPFQDGSLVVAMQDQPSPFFSSFVSRGGLLLLPSFQRPPLLESNGGGYFTQSSVARGFPPNPCFGCASLPQPKNFSTPLFASISYDFETNFFLLLLDFSIRGETFRKIREDGKKKMLELGGTKGWKEGVESHRAMRISRGGGFVSLHALRGITESESRWSRPPSSNFSRERNNGLKEACDPERRGEK